MAASRSFREIFNWAISNYLTNINPSLSERGDDASISSFQRGCAFLFKGQSLAGRERAIQYKETCKLMTEEELLFKVYQDCLDICEIQLKYNSRLRASLLAGLCEFADITQDNIDILARDFFARTRLSVAPQAGGALSIEYFQECAIRTLLKDKFENAFMSFSSRTRSNKRVFNAYGDDCL